MSIKATESVVVICFAFCFSCMFDGELYMRAMLLMYLIWYWMGRNRKGFCPKGHNPCSGPSTLMVSVSRGVTIIGPTGINHVCLPICRMAIVWTLNKPDSWPYKYHIQYFGVTIYVKPTARTKILCSRYDDPVTWSQLNATITCVTSCSACI